MKASDLIAELSEYVRWDRNIEVEIATCPRSDEWYEVSDVERRLNFRGTNVIVINTD
jgi:hypothetical protein